MTWPTIPNTFSPNTKAVSSQANANFTALKDAISSYVQKTNTDYTITDIDGYRVILVSTGNTGRTITLPTAADNANRIITIKKIDSGTGTVTVDGEGAETIDGATTFVLDKRYDSVTIQCDGAAWYAIDSGNLPTINFVGQASAPGNPSSGFYKGYVSTSDGKLHLLDSSGNDTAVGSGASGRNYLSDWFEGNKSVGSVTNSITATGNITVSTTSWQASDTSKLTVTTTTSTPLRQTSCLLLDHIATGAAFVQTPCFLLDSVDLGKPVSVSFDVANIITSDDYQVYAVRYNSSGTYQEQIPIAGTASATSPYSARIPTGTTSFRGFFIASSTSTDYYVIRFYRNSASDTTDIKVDSLYAGPQSVTQGNAVGQPIAFPIASAGGLGTPTNVVAYYQQVGKFMEVTGSFNAGTVAGTSATLPMPSGLTIDTAYLGSSSRGSVGKFWSSTTGAATFLEASGNSGTLFCDGSDGSNIYIANKSDGTGVAFAKATGTGMSGNGAIFSFVARIPISQWSSSTTIADRAVEEYVYTTGTWDADSSTTGYGSSGTTMGGALTAARTKTMTLQTVTQVTDRFFLEFKDSSSSYTAWQDSANLFPYVYQNTTEYGARIVAPTGSSTIQVVFNQYRRPTGATYGSAGESWGVSLNWRVRKVSGGAAVGFPIGARNIVGDTSGTTVPAGYLNETGSSVVGSTNHAATTVWKNVTSITLQPGKYWLFGVITTNKSGATMTDALEGCIATASASTTGSTEGVDYSYAPTSQTVTGLHLMKEVNITSATTYYLNTRAYYSAGTPTFTGSLRYARVG